jgi:hypothetical protein
VEIGDAVAQVFVQVPVTPTLVPLAVTNEYDV